MIDGLTGDQRFFLGYAQSRREHTREATLRNLIATDGHAPGRYRAETVRNLDAWYAAFNVQPASALSGAGERVQDLVGTVIEPAAGQSSSGPVSGGFLEQWPRCS